jgi:CubicO group peptidase (beta-lactamase class C family)
MAAFAQVHAPEKLMNEWLESFNSGDRARLVAFSEKYDPERLKMVDRLTQFRQNTGGFTVIRVLDNTPDSVKALVKENAGDQYAEFEMKTKAEGDAVKVASLRIQAIPTPTDLRPKRLTAAELTAELDKQVKQREQPGASGALLAVRNGQVVAARTWGHANRENKIAVNADTRFRIGSMNKMFTAVAVLQLADKGKLELDKPIGTYLKSYPNESVAQKVTVRHLLTHTGGTGDIFGPEFEKNRLQLRSIGDYVNLYGKRDLQYEPGARWQYSNYGFMLLGAIIEAVSGQSYYDYVRDNVFKAAGMTRTDSMPEEETVDGRAIGYMNRDGKWVPNTDTLPYRGTSAGGGYSTVGDLRKFAEALLAGKLIKKETLAEATKDQRQGYGFGFGVRSAAGEPKTFGHGGGAPGMNGDLKVFPENGWIVVVLSNMDPPAASRLSDWFATRMPI